jgi:hypothetical protein
MSLPKRLPSVLLSIACIGACDAPADRADAASVSRPPDATALPETSATLKPLASGSPARDPDTLTGTWEGRYEAKRAKVELPGKLKDRVRAKDDGKAGIGAGTITLTIAQTHEVLGKVKGALGDATVIGELDGEMLRAAISPDDPNAEGAMTGVFEGTFKEGRIHVSIRAGSPDATIVREAKLVMEKHRSDH